MKSKENTESLLFAAFSLFDTLLGSELKRVSTDNARSLCHESRVRGHKDTIHAATTTGEGLGSAFLNSDFSFWTACHAKGR